MKAQYTIKDKRHGKFKRWCQTCQVARYQIIRTDETLYQCAMCDRFVCEERQYRKQLLGDSKDE
jgi:hypothetical protein